MRVDHIEAILRTRRPRFIYTMPSLHNPTGVTLSEERRERLVTLGAPLGRAAGRRRSVRRAGANGARAADRARDRRRHLPLEFQQDDRAVAAAGLDGRAAHDLRSSAAAQAVLRHGVEHVHPSRRRGLHAQRLRRARARAAHRTGRTARDRQRGDRASTGRRRCASTPTPTATTSGPARRASSGRARCSRAPSGSASRSCSAKPFFAQGGGDHHFRLALTPVPREAIEEGIKRIGQVVTA